MLSRAVCSIIGGELAFKHHASQLQNFRTQHIFTGNSDGLHQLHDILATISLTLLILFITYSDFTMETS